MSQSTILEWAEKIKADREGKKKKAYASAVKTQTEIDPRVVETKELDIQRKYKEAKEKAKGSTPQEDMLRFGKKRQEYRNLAYKTTLVDRTDNDLNKMYDEEGRPIKDFIATEIPGNELFKEQIRAYSDSLKLAGLAQKYNTRTPNVRQIDESRDVINNEFNKDVERYMKIYKTQKLPQSIDMESYAKYKATNDLIRKYGKGIIPLLNDLKNR